MKHLALCVTLLAVAITASAEPEAIPLFNGKDFAGWKFYSPAPGADPARTWTVKNGVIACTGRPAGLMRTEKSYGNYRLHIEWRWTDLGGNSGVLVHCQGPEMIWPKSVECQLETGSAGDIYVTGGADFQQSTGREGRRFPKKEPSSEKPLGEWNQCEIECRAGAISYTVNGVAQNAAAGCNLSEGYIALQSEGAAMEFRNIALTPLEK